MDTPFACFRNTKIPDRIAGVLAAEIASRNQPGDRLPTVMELAQRFDVSKHSITNALEILVNKGLIEKSPGRGIRVAERRQSQRWVGIVSEMDLLHPCGSSYFQQLAFHVRNQLHAEGLPSEIYLGRSLPWEKNKEPTCERFVADLRRDALSGVVVLASPRTPSWEALWRSVTIPVVGSHRSLALETNYAALMRAGLQRLKAEGCRRVALLGWRASASEAVFESLASELGLKTSPAFICSDLHPSQPGSGWEGFREIWSTCAERPDGLLITDDGLLDEVASAITELGIRVPQQLRVASITHGAASRALPFPIISLEVDTEAAARILVEFLLQQMGRREARLVPQEAPFSVRFGPLASQAAPMASLLLCRQESAQAEMEAPLNFE